MSLSNNLKTIRSFWNLSQKTMGFVLGATNNMVQSYEREKADPPKFFLDRLSKLTGKNIEELKNTEIDFWQINKLPERILSVIELIESLENNTEELEKIEALEIKMNAIELSKEQKLIKNIRF